MSRSDEFDGSRLESLENEERPLTLTQTSLLNKVKRSGTVDAARLMHNVSQGTWELACVNDEFNLNTVRQKDVDAVSNHIKSLAQKSLTKAGYGDTLTVYRAGDLRDEVVPVSTSRSDSSFFGEPTEYRVRKEHVLTHGEGFLGNQQTFAENELHVHSKDLIPVESEPK